MSTAAELTFLVEHYRPGTSPEEFRAAVKRVQNATEEMRHGGAPVRFLHSTLVPEDETYFCVLAAPDAALVQQAYRQAGVGFERIVSALEL